ncbi:MAG TPA: HEAT repeat domain-containing protein [Vicinamibacteria bacterium]
MSLRPRLANLGLAAVSTVLFGGALEGGARLMERARPKPPRADYIWDWQEKWRGEFYRTISSANGWPPWEEFNADGVRDRRHGVEKPEGVARVVFLGDSVTLGAEVAPSEAFPQVLQARVDEDGRPIEVFNVALWGWSTRQERIAYRTIARKYAPDLVVLAVCLNDIPELQDNLARPPRWLSWLHERSAIVRTAVNARGREIRSVEEMFQRPDSAGVREALGRFFEEVRALRRDVQDDGASLAVIVFPFRFQVIAGAPQPHVQQRIADFCASERLGCLDLLPALGPQGAAAFVDYDHLTAEGAKATADAIDGSGLLPRVATAAQLLGGAPAPRGPGRLPELSRRLSSADPPLRAAAAWALGRSGDPASVAPLRAALADSSERVRREAARALGAVGPRARPAAPELFAALRDAREAVRGEAARALAGLDLHDAAYVPELVRTLQSDDPYVRGFAAWTLGNVGPAAKAAVPALVAALDYEEGYDRGGAATALAKMGAAAREAVPALVAGLRSPDGDRRWKAARTLGRIGPAAADAIPALVQALDDTNEHVRIYAARALGRMGPHARQAIPALERTAREPDPEIRQEAIAALERLREG